MSGEEQVPVVSRDGRWIGARIDVMGDRWVHGILTTKHDVWPA
jgi:hypothetical protein